MKEDWRNGRMEKKTGRKAGDGRERRKITGKEKGKRGKWESMV